ncbi:MAG: hypothetical protein EP330_17605 [Deltaproteobacteria bacterium]|nr:MAG: hypothetical protein EP330_17605 [Deltaproteobacteria bacterium]
MKTLVVALLFVAAGVWHVLSRPERYAMAMRAQCLCCDGYDVTEREDFSYLCGRCGFDSRWEGEASKAEAIAHMRALTRARDDLRMAREALRDQSAGQEERQTISANYALTALDHLQDTHALDPTLIPDLEGRDLAGQERRIEQARTSLRDLLLA